MKRSPPDALYAYWTTLRGTALAPRRFDIEPSRIAPLLSHTFILEKLSPRDFRYRIAGSSICEMFGLELREHSFFDGFNATDTLQLERALAVVTRRGGVSWFEIEATRATTNVAGGRATPVRANERLQPPVKICGVLLPLLHTEGRIDRVLGALDVVDPDASGRALDWIGRQPLTGLRLGGLRTEWPRPADSHTTIVATLAVAPKSDSKSGRDFIAAGRNTIAAGRATDRSPRVANPAMGAGQLDDPNFVDGSANARQTPFKSHIRKSRIVRSDRRQFRVYDGGRTDVDDKSQ